MPWDDVDKFVKVGKEQTKLRIKDVFFEEVY